MGTNTTTAAGLDQFGARVSLSLVRAMQAGDYTPTPIVTKLATLLAAVLAEPAAMAALLLHHFGSLGAVLVASEERLLAVPGMNAAAVCHIRAVHELAALALSEQFKRDVIGGWLILEEWARLKIASYPRECLVVLFLDRKNGLIQDEMMAEGTISHVSFYAREVARRALELHASAVIVLHNHPSGDPTPSPDDVEMTEQAAQALACLGIALHDHAIVGRNAVISMRSWGLLLAS